KQVNAGHVGFQLGPRINASGRISDATIAVQLLRSHDLLRARETAVYLDAENRERQEIETVMLSEALAMLADFDGRRDQVIVLAKEGWHPGVIGIVASRLVEKFYCPAILISLDGGEGKGSGRSIQGFDLYQALQTCSDILVKFGGHRQAAGLTIKAGQVDKLRERLNSFARLLPQEFYRPRLHIDARVEGEQITPALIGELSKLEPFGYGNPNPVLRLDNLNLLDVRQVGKDHTHLKVKVKCGNRTFAGIGFGLGEHLGLLEQESTVEAAFTPVFNEYNGHKTIQLQLKDIRAAGLSSQPVQTLIANFHRLTSAEQDVLTLLAQGSSCSAPQNCSLLFPLTAAVNQVLAAGKASVVVYPRAALAKSIANLATRIFPQSGQTVPLFCVDKMVTLPEATGIFIIGNDSIAGDWARIEQLGANLGLIVLDSLDVPQPAKLDRQFPILRSQTSAELVQTMAPNRERLGRLYKLLASLNTTERRFLGAVLPQLAERLAENTEFVNIGLQIFEELHIIKRENSDSERIFYFQVPKEKLNLLNSSLYRQGLEVLQDYAGTA
ncbi:MAG TPA: DHHA1 domain-containing protein, partial [Desulfobacteria bacterium]|nr:DHHA1 domain-containing protein [Desulfobacteria bacterium]